MTRIPYNDVENGTVGGNEAAELINLIIEAKAKAVRVAARLNVNSNDGADPYVMETAGVNGSVYSVVGGQGTNFYNAFLHASTGIITLLNAISDELLATVDLG